MIPTGARIFLATLAVVGALGSVVVGRALLVPARQPDVEASDGPEIRDGAVRRLARAVRIRSISPRDFDSAELRPFEELHESLAEWFPRTHRSLERREIEPCSLLYRWKGADPDLQPALWLSHLDVVPPEAPESWTHPPFSGAVRDGYVWGRGTIDVKSGVMGILEATETLLASDVRPERTMLFAFGCDEEVGGERGAKKIAARLANRGVEPAYVLDEGQFVTEGLLPGLDRPVAVVGVAEKGYLTVELTARSEGGHSTLPPRSTAVGKVSQAVVRLENHPMSARLNGPVRRMFRTLAPELPWVQRLAAANLWLFEPFVVSKLTGSRTTNAVVRTTTAATTIEGGTRENVLPARATAEVNYRIAPGDKIDDVRRHVDRVVGDGVEIDAGKRKFASNPSPVASTQTPAYRAIRRNVRRIHGAETLVAPGLTVGATDSRYFTDIADDVYRFMPIVLGPDDPNRIHGVDERLPVEGYRRLVRFYMAMLRDA